MSWSALHTPLCEGVKRAEPFGGCSGGGPNYPQHVLWVMGCFPVFRRGQNRVEAGTRGASESGDRAQAAPPIVFGRGPGGHITPERELEKTAHIPGQFPLLPTTRVVGSTHNTCCG